MQRTTLRTLQMMALATALAIAPATSDAQAPTKDQQRCLNGLSKAAGKVAGTLYKEASRCVKSGTLGKLPMGTTAQQCLEDDLRGKVAKARSKVDKADTKSCQGAGVPPFGYTDADTVSDPHEGESIAFVSDQFDTDLDVTLAANAALDPKARCGASLVKTLGKLDSTLHKEFDRCLKSEMKAGTITDLAGMAACVDAIATDARGKVAKAVAKVEKIVGVACPAGQLTTLFPPTAGLCAAYGTAVDAPGFASCEGFRSRCRVCRALEGAFGFQRGCDDFDNGAGDGTCPECPNGVVDIGEECDDGNSVDGDGCTGSCIDEFCGDGVINDGGAEACDDGAGNSDVDPDACRTDCSLPSCGDGVIDSGEACDDGGVDTADCDSDCTAVQCGDGHVNSVAGEECDDANASNTDACLNDCSDASCGDGFVHSGVEDCDGTECCDGSCAFEAAATPCTGPTGPCVAPTCDGAGTCQPTPANEGTSCDDGDECSVASECQSGTCTPTQLAVTRDACRYVLVGSPNKDTELRTGERPTFDAGDFCGLVGDIGIDTVIPESLITTGEEGGGPGALIGQDVVVDGGDIVTNNFGVQGRLGAPLPGLDGVTNALAAGQHVNKTPAPTFYDTTGTDPRVAECQTAQAGIALTEADLLALPIDQDRGTDFQGLNNGANPQPAPIVATKPGMVNVVRVEDVNGTASGRIIEIDGAGNADTVVVLRIDDKLNTAQSWQFNLVNGMQPENFLIWGRATVASSHCALGISNTGGGTIFCPNTQVNIQSQTTWTGAVIGGGGGTTGRIRVGDDAVWTFQPFLGF